MMDFTRCYSCMQKLSRPEGRCPRCGHDNATIAGLQPEHALPCGYLLDDRYVIGRMLGQGGFGVTYIGWDQRMEQRVCIKEYFPAGAAMRSSAIGTTVIWGGGDNAEELRRGQKSFTNEARKAVKLRDLNSVVKVWDVFDKNDTAYLVMDYIEGVTLKHHLMKTRKPLREEECLQMLTPVMRELKEVHARGIIHRDISPDNLMLKPDGSLVLLDIGAAKDLSLGSGQSSMVIAKKGFSPLEQYAGGGKIGPWTDVYAMCATIVYCVTGNLLPEWLSRLSGEEPDLSAFTPAVAEALKWGLAIYPEDRIQSMDILLHALGDPGDRKYGAGGGAAIGEHGIVSQSGGNKHDPPKSSFPGKILALVCALVIAGLAVWKFVPASEPQDDPVLTPSVDETAAPRVVTPAPSAYTDSVYQVSTTAVPDVTAAPKEEIHWSLDNGELTISGTGRMQDYSTQVAPWRSKADMAKSISSIIVQEGVTHIGSQAFQYCANVKSVSLAASVESVGKAAFYGCAALESIDFPTEMKDDELAVSLFDRCTALKYFKIPEGVTVIRNAAFNRCTSLEWVYIPASVRVIENSAFNSCGSLKEVYFGGSMEEWEKIEISAYNKYLKNADIRFDSALN